MSNEIKCPVCEQEMYHLETKWGYYTCSDYEGDCIMSHKDVSENLIEQLREVVKFAHQQGYDEGVKAERGRIIKIIKGNKIPQGNERHIMELIDRVT